jgi:hypothetical protein
MWNEAWVDDHWMPLDATLERHGLGATRLTLGHSALDSGHAFTGFLPVIQVLGQLELEIVDVQLQEAGGQ